MKLDNAQLATIRELLSDAFNSSEIDTLAFDLFQSVYRDFSPAMTRSTKIRSIVEHANYSGRIHDLLFYTERENPHQYSLYAAKLTPVWQKLNSTSSDLRAINQLMGDAFSSGDIDTLAFDLFQSVYRDFGPGMARAQKIEAIVLYAEQNGRIPDLLAYVQHKNPYQYERYAARLAGTVYRAQEQPSVSRPYYEQRLHDIRRHIERDMQLLRKYEEQLSYEDDPRRIMRIEKEIERQRGSLTKYQKEAAGLVSEQVSPTMISEMQSSLHALDQQIAAVENQLAAGQRGSSRAHR